MKKIILLIIFFTLASCNTHDEVKYVNKDYSIEVRLFNVKNDFRRKTCANGAVRRIKLYN